MHNKSVTHNVSRLRVSGKRKTAAIEVGIITLFYKLVQSQHSLIASHHNTGIPLSILGGVRLEPSLRPKPSALNEAVPVHAGEEVLLEVVEHPPGHILASDAGNLGERLIRNTAVLELAEHELVVARQQGARGVAGVAGLQLLAADGGQQVVNQDGGLGADGGRGLGVGQRGGVTDGEDVGVLVVLGCGLVNVDPSG